MYGPTFLVFYALVITGGIAGCWTYLRSIEPATPSREVPTSIDPYEFAYLRGGENEVIRTVTIALLERGMLELTKPARGRFSSQGSKVVQASSAGDQSLLSDLESVVFGYCRSERSASAFFQYDLTATVARLCKSYHANLVKRGLMPTDEAANRTRNAFVLAGLAVLALGGYKVYTATMTGHNNIGFLLVEMVVSAVVFLSLGWNRRITFAGQQYVKDVRKAFSSLPERPNIPMTSEETVLIAGIFGVGMMTGAQHASYAAMFRQSAGGDGGGGCGGGGGGGGGCGGCGGGG